MNSSRLRTLYSFAFIGLLCIVGGGFVKGDIVSFNESFSGIGATFDATGWTVFGEGQFETNGAGENVYTLQSTSGSDYDGIQRTVGAGSFRSEFQLANPQDFGGLSTVGIRIVDDGGHGLADEVRLFLTESSSTPGSLRAIFSSTTNGTMPYTAGELFLGSEVTALAFRLDYEMNPLGTGAFWASVDVNNSGNFIALGTIEPDNYGINAALDRKLTMELSPFGSLPRIELNHATMSNVPEPAVGFTSFLICCAMATQLSRRRRNSQH